MEICTDRAILLVRDLNSPDLTRMNSHCIEGDMNFSAPQMELWINPLDTDAVSWRAWISTQHSREDRGDWDKNYPIKNCSKNYDVLLKKMDWMFSFKNDLVAHARDLYYELYKKKCEHEKLKKKYESHMEEKEKQVSSLKV